MILDKWEQFCRDQGRPPRGSTKGKQDTSTRRWIMKPVKDITS